MDIALSTHLFVNHRLTTVWLDRVWDAGIALAEVFCARQHLDYRDNAQIRELGHWFRDSPLKLNSVHAPMYTDDCWGRTGPDSVISLTEPVKFKRIAMVDEVKRAIEIAEQVPFRYLIQHLGVRGEEFSHRKLDAAFTALEELNLFARQRGVEILLENTPNDLSTAERLMYFNDTTHLNMNFCFDTGHAHMMEGIPAAFAIMKDRIRSTHIHDNDGQDDLHFIPFLDEGGTIDWPQTMALLKGQPGQYPLMLELRDWGNLPNPLQTAKSVFARLLS
jgi:sugar phosphate isomerase/epimerase